MIKITTQEIREAEMLVAQIQTIDEHAAEKLVNLWENTKDSIPCGDLLGSFVWSETPQGHQYWSELAVRTREIGEKFNW